MQHGKRSHGSTYANDSSQREEAPCNSKRIRRSQIISTSQQKRNSQNVYDQSVRCGKIVSLHLENFMCHSNLCVDFGQRVNFLVGNNGSGKSAVLTALVLGLGSNARITNRSTSVQKLIKMGENNAKIEITLENNGLRGFQPEVYGNFITIVRNIRQSGSSYAIKDCRGNVISRKLDDLRRILMYFNIRVDNPIFVLNQDSAREFLKDLEPRKNYQLFLKASQLDIITESLGDCKDIRTEQVKRLTAFKDKIDVEKKEIAQLEGKLQMIRMVEEMKNEVVQFEIILAWNAAKKHETDLAQIEQKIATIEKRTEELGTLTARKDDIKEQFTQQIKEFDGNLKGINENYFRQERVLHETKKQVEGCNERIRALQARIKNEHKHESHLQQCLQDLEQHMTSCENDKQRAMQLMEKNTAAMAELDAQFAESEAIIESAKRDQKIFYNSKVQCSEQKSEVQHQSATIMSNLNGLRGQLTILNGNARNKLSIFGEDVVSLVNELETLFKARRFSQLPRGPVGRYIQVPNSKYRDVIEYQLNSVLRAFVVASDKDRVLFNEVVRTKFPRFRASVIRTTFTEQVYNVSKGCVKPPPNTRLLMDEIICDDPVVMNLLIDCIHIESILLTDSKEIAEELTAERENVPPRLMRILVPNLGLEYVAAPNYAMYSLRYGQARFIQVDVKERKRQIETEISTAQKRIDTLNASLQEINKELQDYEQQIRDKRVLIDVHEKNKRDFKSKKYELENYDYPPQNDMVVLQKEFTEIQTKLSKIDIKVAEVQTELDGVQTECQEIDAKVQENKKMLEEIDKERQRVQNENEKVKMEMRNLDYNMEQNNRKLKAAEELLKTQMERRCLINGDLANAIAEASRKGERIESGESDEAILDKLKRYKAKINQRHSLCIDSEEIRTDLAVKQERLKVDVEKNEVIKNSIEQLKRSWVQRVKLLTSLQHHAAMSVFFVFNQILKVRHFDGDLNIDHRKKTIEVRVTPRASEQKNANSSTRSLSGGERSYTTVALLKALWFCSDHPFYFLDEYDVFTDEVNREYITTMLIQEGERYPNRQFCFLTPQNTKVTPQNYIKVHRLAEPMRGVEVSQ